MILPLKYSWRNVRIRWRSTLATILGIALVSLVFILLQSLVIGIEQNSANTGDPRNLLVVRKGATAESSSLVTRSQWQVLKSLEGLASGEGGAGMISAEAVILANLPRRDGSGEANVLFRGVTSQGVALRPQVKLVSGRWFVPGKREIVVSERLAKRFANFDIGGTVKSGPASLTVVGWFDAGRSAYDSECWMDAEEARSVFERDMYSSVLLRPADPQSASNLVQRIESDKRLLLRVEPETDYYKKQTLTAAPIKWLGGFLAITMSIGAVFAAMNTMYASVAARTREIGTLRVLGYRRRTVVIAFLLEGALLAAIGGIIGGTVAYLKWNGMTTATLSVESFSETIFAFTITPALLAKGLAFSVAIGLAGTLFPAARASRTPIIAALKSI